MELMLSVWLLGKIGGLYKVLHMLMLLKKELVNTDL